MNIIQAILTAVLLGCGAGVYGAEPSLPPADESKTTQTPKADSYQIRNKKYGEMLRPEDANNANGTPIVLYSAQPWKCMTWKFHPAGEATFFLQNHFTSKTFSGGAANPSAPQTVVQVPFAKESAACPGWRFAKLTNGTYKITDAKTGEALTATKGAGYAVRIILQPWQESDEQKWELIEIDPSKLTM